MVVANCDLEGVRTVSKALVRLPAERVEQAILLIRGERVLLDSDLAKVYGVETKALNRAVKRNLKRFPSDFVFQLTEEETAALRYQFGTSNLKSQSATFKIPRRKTLSSVCFHRARGAYGGQCP